MDNKEDILNESTRQFIRQHACDDVRTLALHARREPGVDMQAAITQIAGRQTLAGKVPSWAAADDILCPPRLSLEQCSSEATARYKTAIICNHEGPRRQLTDLTGGLGIDCSFLARFFEQADYVERQETLCKLARHNFPALGLTHISVHCDDAAGYLKKMGPADWIFLDPARRDSHGGKTVAMADCDPDVTRLQGLLLEKAAHVLLKLSPMLDLSQAMADLKQVSEVHIVAVSNECKELLLVLERDCRLTPDEVPIACVNLPAKEGTDKQVQRFTFCRKDEKETPSLLAEAPDTYLYEPHTALLKGGAFRCLARHYGIRPLHPNSHLYTSAQLISDFPGRIFRTTGWSGFGKKELKTLLHEVRQANLSVRNFPASVADLRKRLHLAEGGDVYLFATTLSDGQKVLIRTVKEG